MITLNCDKCEKTFETDDDAAGEKVQCPYCGDVNRVPAAVTVPMRAAPVARPVINGMDVPTSQPEQTIAVVRQAMFRAHPFWYTLMVLIFLGGIALAAFAGTSSQFATSRWVIWVGVACACGAALWWLIWWAAPHRWIKLTITNKRTIRQEGIIVRNTSEVLHDHIRNVKINQTFLERLLGVGSISIDSAAGGGSSDQHIEIHMDHIPQPYRVKELIDKHRRI